MTHNHRTHGKHLQRYAYLYNASLGTADITVRSKGCNGLQRFPISKSRTWRQHVRDGHEELWSPTRNRG